MKKTIAPRAKAAVPQSEIRQTALRTTGLLFVEDITLSTQSANQRWLPFDIDFFP